MPKKEPISALDLQRPASRSEGRTRRLAVQKALGVRIAQLRKKKQASQEFFADACGLHRSHMGEIERGESNFTLGTLLLLVKQLDITVSELFNGIV
jgi:DNA-binding XRE family transcriptional regulator